MVTSFIVQCPVCGQKNRALIAKRSRCGKCKREFSTDELATAAMGASLFGNLGGGIDTVQWKAEDGTVEHETKRKDVV